MLKMISTSDVPARKVDSRESVWKLLRIASMRPRKSPGTLSIFSPKKSLICVLAISTAIPFVNPITTGRGMKRTAVPKPVAPIITNRIPAINVQRNNPSTPYLETIPKTITTKAPVGPPIWVSDPPSAEIIKPATTAV